MNMKRASLVGSWRRYTTVLQKRSYLLRNGDNSCGNIRDAINMRTRDCGCF